MSFAYLRSTRYSLIVLFLLYRSSDSQETLSTIDKGVEMDKVGHSFEEHRVDGKV